MSTIKNVVILGSTGSIGRNTLDIIRRHPNRFKVVGLAAGGNVDLVEEQVKEFKPKVVALYNQAAYATLKKRCNRKGIKILSGVEGIVETAIFPESDFVLSAIVGAAGLLPTMAAIKAGKDIGLANKEVMVMAGDIVMEEAKKNGIKIIPVDSEHSAIYQCLIGAPKKTVKKLILTASGGPFRKYSKQELTKVTPEDALKHPNWDMGKKISIDSATMMNKGLEVIEAKWLFNMDATNISVVIHPQSIVHSMVEFIDSSVIAQMGLPDMRVPISYALNLGVRVDNSLESLDLTSVGSLTFDKPDVTRFPCLQYAFDAIEVGKTLPSVLNAGNEIAVNAFIAGSISFNQISNVVRTVMDSHEPQKISSITDAMKADKWARKMANEIILTKFTK